jgi:hypothetical protein
VAVRYLKTLPDDAYMVFVSDVPYFFKPSDLEFLRGHRIPGIVTADLLPLFRGESGPWTGHDLRVLMQEPFEHEALAALLRKRFPDAECIDATHPERPPQAMTACRIVDLSHGAFAGGIRAKYYRGKDEKPFEERDEPAISYGFLPEPCRFPTTLGKPPCRVEWDGEIEIGEAGTYMFQAEARHGGVKITIDGQALPPAMELAAGRHTIHAEARFAGANDEAQDGGARLLWRRTASDPWELVPFGQLSGQ